ncbi:MAG: thioredoxin family protein [Alphaproteobacteria bacterium]
MVDVTADWCVTCQVNKAAVLNRGEVARRLAAPGVVAMRADWTRPNDEIAGYLAGFGRYGIPFNAVYGPGAPDGLPLPELLTTEAVLAAINRAGGEMR